MINNLFGHLFQKRWKMQLDEKTIIRPLGRDRFTYQVGEHKMIFYAELTEGKTQRWIEKNSIQKWEPPYENEVISPDAKQHILKQIGLFFAMNNTSYEFF